MLRSLMQIYIKGTKEAVPFYERVFGITSTNNHINYDGSYMHSELSIFGQIVAISETSEELVITGNAMQFCLHFSSDEKELVEKLYKALKEESQIITPIGQCFYSELMFVLIDKYGVNWCVFC